MADGDTAPKTSQARAAARDNSADAVAPGVTALQDAQAVGYLGPNPIAEAIPNERYSLKTGPDGVPLHEEMAIAAAVHARDIDEDTNAKVLAAHAAVSKSTDGKEV